MSTFLSGFDTLFVSQFGDQPDRIIIRSPGRVNLIGEHTDYNEGFVLPAAIDRCIIFVIAPRADQQCRMYAADLRKQCTVDLESRVPSDLGWPNYLLGVFDQFLKRGAPVRGCDIVFGGNVPIGAGLSSSAAIEGGLAFALNELFGLGYAKIDLVRLAQKAENEFVGVQCGIMDQYINIFGAEQSALKIDCRSQAYELFPFKQPDLRLVLCETPTRRSLASSEYNVRRRQCDEGVAVLRKHNPAVNSLRDATPEMLLAHRPELDPVVFRRCAYVVAENERVLGACADLQQGDADAFGRRMFASHAGLRDEYQVSSKELDILVDIASGLNGVLGARMMGAGFGGCTINLVREQAVDDFVSSVSEQFRVRTGTAINVFSTRMKSGTSKETL